MTSGEAGAPGAAWHDQRVAWLRQTDDAILPRPQAPAGGWIGLCAWIADGGKLVGGSNLLLISQLCAFLAHL